MITSSNIIDSVIDEFIANKRAFTAFEVTLEARNRGSTERHLDQRQYIHSKMVDEIGDFGDYIKTLIDIGNGTMANLYHPIGYDIKAYPTAINTTQSLSNTKTCSTTNSVQSIPPVTIKSVDSRQTLLIPSRFIKSLGLKPQNKVFISIENSILYITRSDETNKARNRNGICYYVVNEDHHVRITQSTLRNAKIAGTEYEIIGGPEITVKLVK